MVPGSFAIAAAVVASGVEARLPSAPTVPNTRFPVSGDGQTQVMSSRNVLVVALDPVSDEEIKTAIDARQDVAGVSVHVVAPAAGVGRLQRLTGAVDEARAEAEELAERTAHAVGAEVETEVGDRDPIVAVEDALRQFAADEILLAGSADGDVEAGLRRFGLPVSRVDDGADGAAEEPTGPEALARDVTEGRKQETPLVLLGIVGAVLLAAIVLISLIAFLVIWLT